MAELNEEMTRWSFLAEEAKAGRLLVDKSVAKDCRDACNKQIALYERLLTSLEFMSRVTGLGRFDCADKLAEMLGAKAIGGEGDFYSAITAHIAAVTLIRDTIEVSVARYDAQDQAAAAAQDNLLN
ncbi:hypothetical protein ACFVMC_00205 [Nocardia sp. NPDC127579]|uniref:hypothetical protein n=1 Tax=Nocardia sp. NPDC127579 TaxID=3345402 RepID=UPI00363119A7